MPRRPGASGGPVLTVAEAASLLRLGRNTVYAMLQDGTLPAIQRGDTWLISRAVLERWLEEESYRQAMARTPPDAPMLVPPRVGPRARPPRLAALRRGSRLS